MHSATHAAISAAVCSLFIPSVDAVAIAALAAQIPDIDSTSSAIGSILWPLSKFLESRLVHRTFTHSILFCAAVSVLAYIYLSSDHFKAVAIGVFSSAFADIFTKQGSQLFWPLSYWCVMGKNPARRLTSGSIAELWIVGVCVAVLSFSFDVSGIEGLVAGIGNRSNVFIRYPNSCIYASVSARERVSQVTVTDDSMLATSPNSFWSMASGSIANSTHEIVRANLRVGDVCDVSVNTAYFDYESAAKLREYLGTYSFVFGSVTADEPIANGGKFEGVPIGEAIAMLGTAYISGRLDVRTYERL